MFNFTVYACADDSQLVLLSFDKIKPQITTFKFHENSWFIQMLSHNVKVIHMETFS